MLNSRKHGCPFSGEAVIKRPQLKNGLQFVGEFLEIAEVIALLRITGEDLHHVGRRNKCSAGNLAGSIWAELKKPFRSPGTLGWP